jgi:hypothetical protein
MKVRIVSLSELLSLAVRPGMARLRQPPLKSVPSYRSSPLRRKFRLLGRILAPYISIGDFTGCPLVVVPILPTFIYTIDILIWVELRNTIFI